MCPLTNFGPVPSITSHTLNAAYVSRGGTSEGVVDRLLENELDESTRAIGTLWSFDVEFSRISGLGMFEIVVIIMFNDEWPKARKIELIDLDTILEGLCQFSILGVDT